MTFDKFALINFLPIDEVAQRLSEEGKGDAKVSWSDVLGFALDGHLPLIVKIPPGTKAYGSLDIEGLWDLVMEGEQGKHARRDLDRKYRGLADLSPINTEGIDGVWVERDGDRHQLFPYSNLPKELFENWVVMGNHEKTNPALPHGCILGARAEAVEALLASGVRRSAAVSRASANSSRRSALVAKSLFSHSLKWSTFV